MFAAYKNNNISEKNIEILDVKKKIYEGMIDMQKGKVVDGEVFMKDFIGKCDKYEKSNKNEAISLCKYIEEKIKKY